VYPYRLFGDIVLHMPYRLAIFDFDGTLADSIASFLSAFNGLADRHGFRRIEEADLETVRGYDALRMRDWAGIPAWRIPLVASEMLRAMSREIGQVRLFPGVEPMLRTLADRGVTLAVATSNSAANVRRVLGPDLASLVDHFECGASIFGKASRFRRILRVAGIAPADAISIGDEVRDIQASRRAGIPFGAVTWGYTKPDALAAHSPAAMFATPDEVVARVAGPVPSAA
jgi:phosphoglycolate phosphatase